MITTRIFLTSSHRWEEIKSRHFQSRRVEYVYGESV
jgi:hypothetical protein